MNRIVSNILMIIGIFLSSFCVKTEIIYANSNDGKKSYTSIDDAWYATKNSKRNIMQADWNLSSRLILGEGKLSRLKRMIIKFQEI